MMNQVSEINIKKTKIITAKKFFTLKKIYKQAVEKIGCFFSERSVKPIQEEIDNKTVALVISTSKMTGRVLQAAIRELQRQRQKHQNKSYQGKQTIKQLVESGAALSNIEITNKNIKSFEPVAKKYGLDYALKKDKSQKPPKYIVFFKGKDIDVINMAFQEYSQKQLREKPSIRKMLSQMKEIAKTINPKDRARRKEQERDI